MSLDPLQCIPLNQWHLLKSAFKSDWPKNILSYALLETQEKIINLGLDYGFKVYCPFGDINEGIVAVNTKYTLNEIIILNSKDDTTALEYALLNTKILDWSKIYEVPFAPHHIGSCMERVSNKRNLELDHYFKAELFILNKQTPFEVKLPAGLTFELLSLSDVKIVNSVWPHKYLGSEWIFELLTKAKFGYGLFKNTELISWVYLVESGAFGHLYTLEKHRQQGYGEIVLKLFSNILMEEGKSVFAFCDVNNKNAYALYKKLGFENVEFVTWFTIKDKKLSVIE